MSTQKRADAPKLYPKCPASSAGARCHNQKRHPELGLCCQPDGRDALMPLAGVERCPWPKLADLQVTELVCKKHGRGVEALTIAGTNMGGQFCLACSLELLGGMIPQVQEVPVQPKVPELEDLMPAFDEVTPEQVAEAAEERESAASQPALTEDIKPEEPPPPA